MGRRTRNRTRTGGEHAVTQRLSLICPEGHRLADYEDDMALAPGRLTRLAPALGDYGKTEWTPSDPVLPPSVRVVHHPHPQPPTLHWLCARCYRARARHYEAVTSWLPFLALVEWMRKNGPAHLAVSVTRRAARQQLRELAGDQASSMLDTARTVAAKYAQYPQRSRQRSASWAELSARLVQAEADAAKRVELLRDAGRAR